MTIRDFLTVQMVPATVLARMSVWTYGAMGFTLGLLTAIGGPKRWSAGFYQLLMTAPGSPYSWAVIIGVGGLITLAGSVLADRFRTNKIRNTGMIIMVLWMLSFTIVGTTTAAYNPTVALTAPPLCGSIIIAMVIVMFTDERHPSDHAHHNRA